MSLGSIGTKFTSAVGAVNGVASSIGKLASWLTGPAAGSFASAPRKASFGGVPFAVASEETLAGRKVAIHEYPLRDEPWVEDLGQRGRRFVITGWLVEGSLLYEAGGVIEQRDNLLRVAEKAGPTKLLHPTLGEMEVSLVEPIRFTARWDLGPVIEVAMTVIKGGPRLYPGQKPSTQEQVKKEAAKSKLAAALDYAKSIAAKVMSVVAKIQSIVSTVMKYYTMVMSFIADVKSFISSIKNMVGAFGRMFGSTKPAEPMNGPAQSSQSAASILAQRRALVVSSAKILRSTAATGDPQAIATATQKLAASVTTFAADPAEAIRIHAQTLSMPAGSDPVQTATSALIRRSAVIEMAIASSEYQPASHADAQRIKAQVTGALDREILIAGDAGDDATYEALRRLRQAVHDDMDARGGGMGDQTVYSLQSSQPSLTVAQRLYGDASRSDELTAAADPIHPAFMPAKFRAPSK